jgi:hypothetical protein
MDGRTVKVDNHVAANLAILEARAVADLHPVRDDTVVQFDTATHVVSSSSRRREGRSGSLFPNHDILHDDAVGQFRTFADPRVLADDAPLQADFFTQVRVHREVQVRVGRDEHPGGGVGWRRTGRQQLEGLRAWLFA